MDLGVNEVGPQKYQQHYMCTRSLTLFLSKFMIFRHSWCQILSHNVDIGIFHPEIESPHFDLGIG